MERYDIDKIKSIPILDVAEKLNMPIKKKGVRYFTHCLWHEDSNPSMVLGGLYPNLCHCYACGETHDVIALIMAHENTDFKGACEWACKQYSIAPAPPNLPERGGNNNRQSYLKRQEALLAKKNAAPSLRGRAGGEASVGKASGFHYFPSDYLDGNDGMASSFARCIKQVFGGTRTAEIVRAYRLGSLNVPGRYPDVMFPSIDINGRIRDIKVQAYDCDERSDRFFHRTNTCYWLGPKVYNVDDFDRGCLFGEHLLSLFPEKTVALVESPKNACVGAAAYPEFIWVAVGNKSALNREVLRVLQGRRVVVFPDNDAYDDWKAKLDTMQDIATFVFGSKDNKTGKEDIADEIIRKEYENRNRKKMEEG